MLCPGQTLLLNMLILSRQGADACRASSRVKFAHNFHALATKAERLEEDFSTRCLTLGRSAGQPEEGGEEEEEKEEEEE